MRSTAEVKSLESKEIKNIETEKSRKLPIIKVSDIKSALIEYKKEHESKFFNWIRSKSDASVKMQTFYDSLNQKQEELTQKKLFELILILASEDFEKDKSSQSLKNLFGELWPALKNYAVNLHGIEERDIQILLANKTYDRQLAMGLNYLSSLPYSQQWKKGLLIQAPHIAELLGGTLRRFRNSFSPKLYDFIISKLSNYEIIDDNYFCYYFRETIDWMWEEGLTDTVIIEIFKKFEKNSKNLSVESFVENRDFLSICKLDYYREVMLKHPDLSQRLCALFKIWPYKASLAKTVTIMHFPEEKYQLTYKSLLTIFKDKSLDKIHFVNHFNPETWDLEEFVKALYIVESRKRNEHLIVNEFGEDICDILIASGKDFSKLASNITYLMGRDVNIIHEKNFQTFCQVLKDSDKPFVLVNIIVNLIGRANMSSLQNILSELSTWSELKVNTDYPERISNYFGVITADNIKDIIFKADYAPKLLSSNSATLFGSEVKKEVKKEFPMSIAENRNGLSIVKQS